jgi:hypothetical protein
MKRVYTADDFTIVTHNRGSEEYENAQGPVVELVFPSLGSELISLTLAKQIGAAADALDPPATHSPLPVAGYTAQPDSRIAVVNINKQLEERVLRRLDDFKGDELVDQRWLAIGRTHIEQAFMAINRAIFKPERINLPEDTFNQEMTAQEAAEYEAAGNAPDVTIGDVTVMEADRPD